MRRKSHTIRSGLLAALLLLTLGGGGPSLAGPPATLVQVPTGSLESFWREEKLAQSQQPRRIIIPALEAQEHAVTNSDFLRFLGKNPQWRKSRVSPLFADGAYLQQFEEDLRLRKGVSGDAPVTYVSWYAANAYCQGQGLRLPTTDEWEYLSAADEKKPEASKDPAFLSRILEWYARPQAGALAPVKSTYRNYYGLYDMHGLIWEWVEDFNSNLVTGESREDGTVNRNLFCGAGNLSGGDKQNYAAFMRFAFRSSMKGRGSVWNLGFRCVR